MDWQTASLLTLGIALAAIVLSLGIRSVLRSDLPADRRYLPIVAMCVSPIAGPLAWFAYRTIRHHAAADTSAPQNSAGR